MREFAFVTMATSLQECGFKRYDGSKQQR